MSIRLIATDLDGTLLDERKTIPEENLQALERCAEKGVHIVFASGRSYANIRLLAKKLSYPVGIVSLNGGRADESAFGPNVYRRYVDGDTALRMWKLMRETGEYFICYAGEKVYVGNPQPYPGHNHAPGKRGEDGVFQEYTTDEAEFLQEGFMHAEKFVFYCMKADVLSRMREEILKLPVNLFSSAGDNLEALPRDADKGQGVLELAKRLHVRPCEIAAFGDYDNDETMLAAAGYPVAMAGGSDELKKPGRAVTDSVGRYLMKMLEAGEI